MLTRASILVLVFAAAVAPAGRARASGYADPNLTVEVAYGDNTYSAHRDGALWFSGVPVDNSAGTMATSPALAACIAREAAAKGWYGNQIDFVKGTAKTALAFSPAGPVINWISPGSVPSPDEVLRDKGKSDIDKVVNAWNAAVDTYDRTDSFLLSMGAGWIEYANQMPVNEAVADIYRTAKDAWENGLTPDHVERMFRALNRGAIDAVMLYTAVKGVAASPRATIPKPPGSRLTRATGTLARRAFSRTLAGLKVVGRRAMGKGGVVPIVIAGSTDAVSEAFLYGKIYGADRLAKLGRHLERRLASGETQVAVRGAKYGLTRSELRQVLGSWDKGTWQSRAASIRYHFGKHGGGQSLLEYTNEASAFYARNAGTAQWGTWNPQWSPSFRVMADGYKGYYTADGKILTYFPLE